MCACVKIFLYPFKNNIARWFKIFSLMKTERANIKRWFWKLGNITWGMSCNVPQLWVHHVTCLDRITRDEKKNWRIITSDISETSSETSGCIRKSGLGIIPKISDILNRVGIKLSQCYYKLLQKNALALSQSESSKLVILTTYRCPESTAEQPRLWAPIF